MGTTLKFKTKEYTKARFYNKLLRVKIKVKYKKLGKERAWGLADSDGTVYIDSRLKGKKALEILIHECVHLLWKEENEEEVISKSISLCNAIWNQRYRRIEEDKEQLLQDGTL